MPVGGALIIARSFARIHETNLKVSFKLSVHATRTHFRYQKQGVLPLWLADVADYSKIDSGDIIETQGLTELLNDVPNATISLKVTKRDGSVLEIPTKHTMSKDQLKWFRAGSALNHIRSQL